MRIALLSDASVVHTHRWGDALMERGHTIELLSLEPGEGYPYPFIHLDSKVPGRFLRYPLATGRVKAWLERFRPHLVNAHFVPNYGLIGVLAGRRPLVVSVWGSDVLISGTRTALHRARARFVLRRADAVTTDAEMLTRASVALGADPERCLTVPMGVDVARFASASAAHQRPADAPPMIVSTRKLEPVYNVDLLIDAIPEVLAGRPGARFIIAGDGPLRAGYEQRTAVLGETVEFLGMIPHDAMAETLARGDVYVSTSRSDSTSVSLLEAMAAGAFPVVTDIEANHEWIVDGKNGYLVPVDRPDLLAARILEVLDDPVRRQAVGKSNQELIRRRATWDDNMDEVAALFEAQVRAHGDRRS